MGSINNLIEFLRLRRRYEEFQKKTPKEETEVTLQYLEDSRITYTANATEFQTDFIKYKRIYDLLTDYHATAIYLLETATDRQYFVKDTNGVYRNIPDRSIAHPNENDLTTFTLEAATYDYFYDTPKKRVVIFIKSLPPVAVFADIINYGPNEKYLKDVDNGPDIYFYSKPNTGFGKIMESLLDFYSMGWDIEKKVTIRKSDKTGAMSLIPVMSVDISHQSFVLKYPFEKKGFQPTFSLQDDDCAIILKFECIGAFLSFLYDTLFSQGFDQYEGLGRARDNFLTQFKEQVIGILERKITSDVRKYYKDALEILYYLPESLATIIDNKVLWALIAEGIRSGANLSNSISLTKQNIYVKLIEIILLKDNQEERFLDYLSSRIEAILFSDSPFPFSLSSIPTRIVVTGFVPPDPKKITILEYLYERLSGENLIRFAYLVNKAWRRTRFVDSNPRVNKEYRYTTGPKFLPYHSEKNFGFFSSNVSAFFVINPYNEDETILELNLETGEYSNKNLPPIPLPFINEEIINHYYYHPFFPIKIVNVGKDSSDFETAIQLDVIVPAFMIKLNRDEQFWHNVMKAVEYAVDVAAIVLSYGTLSELVAAEVLTSLAVVRGIGAVAGLSSGLLNLVMKLSNSEDSPLGKTLSEYLFWVELLSLSGELTAAIRNGLKRSAMNLVETEEDLVNLEKQLDDAVIEEDGTVRKLTQGEKDEIIQEMKAAAGVAEEKVKNLDIVDEAGDILDVSKLARIGERIRESTKLNNFEILVVDRNNQAFSKMFKAWQNNHNIVEGVFIPKSGIYPKYGGYVKGPKIYLFSGIHPRGGVVLKNHTLQHEIFHAEMHAKLIEQLGFEKYQKVINKIPMHIKEEYVVHRFLRAKPKALNIEELSNEFKRINSHYRKLAGQPSLTETYLKNEWTLKNELKKLKIYY